MKIGAAFATVQRLYIETAPFIYYIEENPRYIDRMDAIVASLDSGQMQAFSSVITLTEVLVLPIRSGRQDLETAYRDILLNNPGVRLLSVSVEIAEEAARLRAHYNLRTPDALHIATALKSRCDAFLTNDNGLIRVRELTIVALDELELDPPSNQADMFIP